MKIYFTILIIASGVGIGFGQWAHQRALKGIQAFAAGVLLAICLLSFLPEALVDGGELAGTAIALGFLAVLFIERYLMHLQGHATCHHPNQHESEQIHVNHDRKIDASMLVALGIHSFLDGFMMYAGQRFILGYALIAGLILHRLAEGASVITLFKKVQFKKTSQYFFTILYLLSAPLGYWVASNFLLRLPAAYKGAAMGFVAGALLHLVTGHLMPEALNPKGAKKWLYVIFGAGFLLLWIAHFLSHAPL